LFFTIGGLLLEVSYRCVCGNKLSFHASMPKLREGDFTTIINRSLTAVPPRVQHKADKQDGR
jgi:hypothetical protein